MGCKCNGKSFGKCRNYGKPGCLCALRDKLTKAEQAEETSGDEAE